ncbi:MAG: hypothetical protein QNJ55_36855 [Xenococcus sp. MO_188.B8]|nr:hypothetical protein [Xenococcus sp. MO_188.B8]
MNDKKNHNATNNLLNGEDKECLETALLVSSDDDFGVTWMPVPQTELHYRVYREEGQLYVRVGKVRSDDTVETYGTNVVVNNTVEAIESELKNLIQQFG